MPPRKVHYRLFFESLNGLLILRTLDPKMKLTTLLNDTLAGENLGSREEYVFMLMHPTTKRFIPLLEQVMDESLERVFFDTNPVFNVVKK